MNNMTKAALKRDDDARQRIKDAADLIKEYIKEIGGCDHSVGICCCDDLRKLARLEELTT